MTPTLLSEARRLWDANASATAIGNKLGLTRRVVVAMARQAGWPARRHRVGRKGRMA